VTFEKRQQTKTRFVEGKDATLGQQFLWPAY